MSEMNEMTICQIGEMFKMRGCFIQKQKQDVFYLRLKIANRLKSDAIRSGVAPEKLNYWPSVDENPRNK